MPNALAKQNRKYNIFLYILSPVLALIFSIKSGDLTSIRRAIFLFVVIYGATLHFSHLGDGAVHYENLSTSYSYLEFEEFYKGLLNIITFSSNSEGFNVDPYNHFMSYFFGSVINAPNLYFMGIGIVFGYFYSGVIVNVISYINWNSKYNKFYFLFFLILFLLWQNPGHMQSVRNGTGIMVLIYAILQYSKTQHKKYLFIVLLPPLFHIGFLALAIPSWLVMFSGFRNPKIYFIIFLISVLSSNIINPEQVNDLASQTEVGQSKAEGYTQDDERKLLEEEKILKNSKNARFYKTAQLLNIQYYALTAMVIFMFIVLRSNGFGKIENTLFSYGLAQASFGNFMNFNPAIHNRSWGIAGVLILALFVMFLSKQDLSKIKFSALKVHFPLFLIVASLVPFLLFSFSGFLNFTSVYVLFMPFIMWFDYDMGISIRGLLGVFL